MYRLMSFSMKLSYMHISRFAPVHHFHMIKFILLESCSNCNFSLVYGMNNRLNFASQIANHLFQNKLFKYLSCWPNSLGFHVDFW